MKQEATSGFKSRLSSRENHFDGTKNGANTCLWQKWGNFNNDISKKVDGVQVLLLPGI